MRAIYSNLLRVIEMQATPGEENGLSAAVGPSDIDGSRAVDLTMKAGDPEPEKTSRDCGIPM